MRVSRARTYRLCPVFTRGTEIPGQLAPHCPPARPSLATFFRAGRSCRTILDGGAKPRAGGEEPDGTEEGPAMKFDLHLHTSRHSPDSIMAPQLMVRRAHEIGLDGVVITEHDWLWTEQE